MGEVSDALVRMYTYLDGDPLEQELAARQIRLEDELADTLSWLFGLVERLGSGQPVDGAKLQLSTVLWDKYGSEEHQSFWCRHCKSMICECPVFLIQNEDEATRHRESLQKLSSANSPTCEIARAIEGRKTPRACEAMLQMDSCSLVGWMQLPDFGCEVGFSQKTRPLGFGQRVRNIDLHS